MRQERLAHYSEVATIEQAVVLAIIAAADRLAMAVALDRVLASMVRPLAMSTADTEVMVERMAIAVAQVLVPMDYLMKVQQVQKVLEVVLAFEAAVVGTAAEPAESCSLHLEPDLRHRSR